jgi:hypothetical protein
MFRFLDTGLVALSWVENPLLVVCPTNGTCRERFRRDVERFTVYMRQNGPTKNQDHFFSESCLSIDRQTRRFRFVNGAWDVRFKAVDRVAFGL